MVAAGVGYSSTVRISNNPVAFSSGQPGPPSPNGCRQRLLFTAPRAPLGASGAARGAIRERFTGVLGRATISDLELVISELVANGVEHGRGTIRVDISHTDGELNGSVSDEGNGFDYELRDVGGNGLRGRGLAIVDALVLRWGIRRGSTRVWFAMSLGDG